MKKTMLRLLSGLMSLALLAGSLPALSEETVAAIAADTTAVSQSSASEPTAVPTAEEIIAAEEIPMLVSVGEDSAQPPAEDPISQESATEAEPEPTIEAVPGTETASNAETTLVPEVSPDAEPVVTPKVPAETEATAAPEVDPGTQSDAEPEAEPSVVPGDAADAESSPSPEASPSTEAEAQETPAAIDYTLNAAHSPAFTFGYAQVAGKSALVYASPDLNTDPRAELAEKSVVYVVSRSADGAMLSVTFNADPEAGLDTGWMDAAQLRPLNPEADIPSYLAFCGSEPGVLFYQNDANLPLNRIPCKYFESPTPNPTVQASPEPTPETTAEITPETTPETSILPDDMLLEEAPALDMLLPGEETMAEPSGFRIPESKIKMGKGDQIDLLFSDLVALEPEGAQSTLTFKSGNKKVVTVGEDCFIRAVGKGKTSIRVSTHNGVSKTIAVTVYNAPKKVGIKPASLTLAVKDSAQLSASFPKNTYSLHTFASSDPKVVAVDENGVVTALKKGSAVITVETQNGKTASCKITVPAAPSEISVSETQLRLGVGQAHKIQGIHPEDTLCSFTYASEDPEIAEIDAEGNLSALKIGKTRIIVSASNSSAKAYCEVDVRCAPSAILTAAVPLKIGKGDKFDLLASGFLSTQPEDAAASYKFKTSNKKFVTVSAAGVIKGVRNGSATITVTAHNGVSKKFKVTVYNAPKKVYLKPESLTLGVEMKGKLELSFPKNTYSQYTVTNANPEIVSMDADGNIVALKAGTATIAVETANGKHAESVITVLDMPAEVGISPAKLKLGVGQTGVVQGTHSETTLCTFTYSSDHPEVAKVDPDTGEITAVAKGSAKITAKANNSTGAKAVCEVEVVPAPKELVLEQSSLKIGKGNTFDLITSGFVKNSPEDSQAAYKFKTSSKKIATVSADGVVKGVKKGSAYITVTAHNGVSKKFKVTVYNAPKKVSVSPAELTLGVSMTGNLEVKFPSNTHSLYTLTDYDEKIISVDEYGKITALKAGETTAKVVTANGLEAGCKVKVLPMPESICKVKVLPMPESISAAESEISLAVGQKGAKAEGVYPNGTMCGFIYASADESIAVVNAATGEIEAVKQGETKIIITSVNSKACKTEVKVKVVPAPKALQISVETLKLGKGNSYDILASGIVKNEPADSRASYTFKTSNKKIATVNADGVIKAVKNGSATITVTAHNGVKASFKVKVYSAPKKVYLKPESLTLGVEMKGKLELSFPKNTYSQYTVTNANPEIVSMDAEGNIVALKAGTATIAVETANGKHAESVITVLDMPAEVGISPAKLKLGVGQTGVVQGTHSETTLCTFTYSSDHPEVAKVDSATGEITAVAKGSAKITAKANNSTGAKAVCEVEVVPAPKELVLDQSSLKIGKGNTFDLIASGFVKNSPEDSQAAYKFKTSSKKIATVSADGVVKGVKKGSAYITVTAHNGVSKKFKVTVYNAPKKVSLSPAELTLGVGMTGNLEVKFPSNTYSLYTLTDYDEKIISVDEYGKITALKAGETTAKVVTANGLEAGCKIHVRPAPKSISLTAPDVMGVGMVDAAAYTLLPADSICSMNYSVVSGDAVEIDASGRITAVKAGKSVIRAATQVKGVYADHTILVKPAPAKVSFSQEEYSVNVGETLQLQPQITKDSVTTFIYKAKKNDFFEIDANGLITAIKRGSTTVTISTHNGLTASVKISVLDPYYPEKLSLANTPPEYMDPGDTYKPKISVYPESAVAGLKWSSSSPDVASVDESTGEVYAIGFGQTVITGKSTRNSALTVSFKVIVLTTERCLKIPARQTDTGDISSTLSQIKAIRQSAYHELQELYAKGVISKSDYNKRRGYVERAFDMHLMPWMTQTKELYWKAANSENGLKDFKPGIVYYGLPYTQTNRRYNKSKAINNGLFVDIGKNYYLMNGSKFTSRNYPGNDCSSFASMAIWGMDSSHSFDNTRDIASTSAYRTLSDWSDLRTGDLLNKGGSHVVMFLYYANKAKTQIMIIEQGGGEKGTNTISCSIRNVSYYQDRNYKIRRVASLG